MQNFEIIEEGEGTILKIYHSFEKDFVFYLEGNELYVFKLSAKKCAKIANRILNVDGKEIPFFVKIIELKNDKTFLSVPFLIVGDHKYLELFLGEQISVYNAQIDKLREKYKYLKENDYLERKDLFKNEYGVSDISDNNFMEFLFRKLPHLKLDFKCTYFKEFNLFRVEELIYRFSKKDFSKEVKEELLHEYFQEIKSKFLSIAKAYSTNNQQLPATEQRGFDLGLTEPQLKVLHQQLIDNTFLAENTKQKHFINAFNGEVLNGSFELLEWIEPTKGAIFIELFTNRKNPWTKLESVMVKANYSKLLSAIKDRDNGIFKETYNLLNRIKNSL